MLTYILYQLTRGFVLFILWYVVIINGVSLLQMVFSLFIIPFYSVRTRIVENQSMGASVNMIPLSLLISAYNEETVIVESITSLLNVNYPNYEIVVINDGSADNTLNAVIDAFRLHKVVYPVRERLPSKKVRGIYYNPNMPRLRVIDKENGGKSDALNAGINFARYPYIVSIDANSTLESDALLRVAMAFMRHKYTVAVGGVLRAANGSLPGENGKTAKTGGPRKIWPLFQSLEYLRSFLVGRIGWNMYNSQLIIPGTFGAFQKEAVLQVGGFTAGAAGEDMDLVIKLHRYMRSKKYRYQVIVLPDLICRTRVPETLGVFYAQRRYWQIGIMDVMSRHRKMFLNSQFGTIGTLAMPYYFLFEIVSPVIEFLGYFLVPLAWFLGFLSLDALILFFAAVFLFGMVTSAGSLAVEEFTNPRRITMKEFLFLGFLSIAENLFFRQITVLFRFMGIFSYHRQKKPHTP